MQLPILVGQLRTRQFGVRSDMLRTGDLPAMQRGQFRGVASA
jgi:hypothetical protein